MNQLKAGAALSYVLIGLNTFIGLIYTPFMLRMLGQSEFGLFSLVAAVISYLTVLDLGFGNAVVRYTSKFRAEGKIEEQYSLFGMFLLIYCAISLISIIIGSYLYFNIEILFGNSMTIEELQRTKIMFAIMIFNLAFTFPFSLFSAIITANERFVFQKGLNIVRTILNPIVMVAMLYMGYRAIGMVVVITVFNVATLLIHTWYCYYKLKIRVRFKKIQWGFFKEVTIYSFWIFLNAIMDRIYWSTGQFVLGVYKGAVAVSVYAVAILLKQMFMNFSTAITSVFLPKVTAMSLMPNSEKLLSDLFIKVGRIQYFVVGFVLSAFIVFGYHFINMWAGQDFSDAFFITLIFFSALLIPLIQNLGIRILQARNRMMFRSVLFIVIAVCSLFLSILLVQQYGAIGCAVAVGLALFLGHGLIMNWYYWKKIKIDIPEFWRQIIKMSKTPVLLTLLGCLYVSYYGVNNIIEFVYKAVFFSALYILASWFLDMNHSEKELVKSFLKFRVK